tara:strand:- start:3316 stop:3828 length:513 start_codon:yes stop_codon:yes gene_type:complete
MLSSFKKPRKNASAAKQQKVNVAKKLASRPVSPPSSDTEADSDSDSDYEEILISSLNGQPKKKPPPVQSKAPVEDKPVEPVVDEPNHANHFTEPEPVVPKPAPAKQKRKKVVIKKYYQQRQPSVQEPAATTPATPPNRPQSYIGISSSGSHRGKPSSNAHSTMSSRILNW